MARLDRHELDCLHVVGKPMTEVHLWLDALNRVFPFQLFGEYHRTFRHNAFGVQVCLENWGPDGQKAALVHLVRDWNDTFVLKQMHPEDVLRQAGKALVFFNNVENKLALHLNPQFANWLEKGWVNQAHKEGLFERGLSRGQIKYYAKGLQHP